MQRLLGWAVRFRWPVSIVGVLLVSLAVFVFDPYRKIQLHKVFSPAWWVLHWQGLDDYDPRTALLQQGASGRMEVALTIDDGPDPRYEPEIAAILRREHVPATFFLVGTRVKEYPELAKLLVADGFTLGNHTYDHQRLPALKPHEIANELRLCDQHIAAVTGQHTHLMRPPGVQYDDKVLEVAKSLGYVTVSWTVGARDYDTVSSDYIADSVIHHSGPGAIILLHQDTPATAAALPRIIQTLRSQGYQFVSLDTMLTQLHAKTPPNPDAAVRLTKSESIR